MQIYLLCLQNVDYYTTHVQYNIISPIPNKIVLLDWIVEFKFEFHSIIKLLYNLFII